MKVIISWMKCLALSAILIMGAVACSAGGGSNMGQLSLSIMDKPSDSYNAVYVTIQSIAVHAASDTEGSWTTIATPNKTVDLLALTNGVREQMALVDLAPGHYTQMRLMIGAQPDGGMNMMGGFHPFANYCIDTGGAVHALKIPSGMQTGIKLVQGFDINADSTTELTLDFDASRSVVVAGNSGKYLLKPTIQVVDTTVATVLNGKVTDQATQAGIGGALVSIQVYDPTAADPKDQVVIMTSTFTDDTDAMRGLYKFFFAVDAPKTIDLVATKMDYTPSALRFPIENGKAYTNDFALVAPTSVGTVAITITGAVTDTPVTLSIRQKMTFDGTDVMVEIKTINVVNGNPDNFSLPVGAGIYSVVASTAGKTTQVATFDVTANTTTTVPIAF
jgi:hypothetical protein